MISLKYDDIINLLHIELNSLDNSYASKTEDFVVEDDEQRD